MTLPWQKNGVRDQVVAIARATDDEGRGCAVTVPLRSVCHTTLQRVDAALEHRQRL